MVPSFGREPFVKFNRIVLSACLVLSAAVLNACGDDDEEPTPTPTPCNEDPSTCGAGETCWPNESFEPVCQPSGTAQDGDECEGLAVAECGEGLWCLPPSGEEPGVCTPLCDLDDGDPACPDGRECLQGLLMNQQTEQSIAFNVCDPVVDTGLAGAGGGT